MQMFALIAFCPWADVQKLTLPILIVFSPKTADFWHDHGKFIKKIRFFMPILPVTVFYI